MSNSALIQSFSGIVAAFTKSLSAVGELIIQLDKPFLAKVVGDGRVGVRGAGIWRRLLFSRSTNFLDLAWLLFLGAKITIR